MNYQIRKFFGDLQVLFLLLLGDSHRGSRNRQVPGLGFGRVGHGRGDRREDAGPVLRLIGRRQAAGLVLGGQLHRRRDGQRPRPANALSVKLLGRQVLLHDDVIFKKMIDSFSDLGRNP